MHLLSNDIKGTKRLKQQSLFHPISGPAVQQGVQTIAVVSGLPSIGSFRVLEGFADNTVT
jgi:hypothetical protein